MCVYKSDACLPFTFFTTSPKQPLLCATISNKLNSNTNIFLKMSSANNPAAMERHLKRIYDCLNIGCNKKAVQEVDRLPKNVRDLTVFKALKSLALIRMYKRRQAFDILNEIDPDDDLDEVTLQTMTSCYKESVDVSKIVDLYEAALKRKPNDADIMAHLFMAHVRVFNFKRQKEIALQMYKNFPKKKRLYSFWAIMSLVMQSQEVKKSGSLENADKRVCLSLAEKMCEKMIDDERTHEEIELYLIILRKQNKHEEEYKFLTGPICLRITDHLSWFNRRRAYLCLDLKMYSRAFKHYFPTLIQEYPDQIEYYQGLFKSAFLLDTEAPSQQQPVAINDQQMQANTQTTGTPVKSTSALTECYDIVEKQCSLNLESADSLRDNQKVKSQIASKNLSRTSSLNPNRRRQLRGPLMARIELYHTIITNENVLPSNIYNLCKNQFSNKFPSLNSLLVDYFQTFSRKILCYYDMDHMITKFKLSIQDKESLVSSIGDWIKDIKRTSEMNEYDYFHVMMNYHMLKHSLHNYQYTDSKEERLKLAKKYTDLYDENRHLGKNTNKTEFNPVDNYCLLAVNAIMTNAVHLDNPTGQSILTDDVIISLIVLTENAIANSPNNHQLKLTLLKLYSFVGASKQSSEVLLSLDIKHFQIDTLGHLLNPVLYNTGNYSLTKESLETCLEFYAHGVRECFEGLTTSYRDGRFSKIEEISNVLKRLCDSLNATQCALLKGIVANVSAATIEELNAACQSFDLFKGTLHRMFRCTDCANTIRDSRDLKVLKSLNAEANELVQKRQSESLADEQLWLKLRYYLIRSVRLQLENNIETPINTATTTTATNTTATTSSSTNTDDKCDHSAELVHAKEVVEDIKLKLKEATTLSSDKRYSYFEPESSPFRWNHINFQSLISLVTPLVFLPDSSRLDINVQEEYLAHLDAIMNNLEEQLSSIQSLVGMKQALLSSTIVVEFISLAITSLVALSYVTSNAPIQTSSNQSSGTNPKVSSSSQQQQQQQQQIPTTKTKTIAHHLMNKTEAQLTRLSNLIKNIDPKTLILDKIRELEKTLLSGQKHERYETKCGSTLIPLMGQEAVQATFGKVKDKLIDSYNESLKEIGSTCRRKVKLFRFKDS